MAYKSFQTFLILQNLGKKIYIAINTSPCVNISVSVHHDSSFRKNGFVLLFCKFSKNIGLSKKILFLSAIGKKNVCKRKILVIEVFCSSRRDLLFLSAIRKKKITKRKTAGCRSRAKIFTFFLKKKNSLRSNSFFFLTEKCKNFFTLFHGGRKLMKNMVNNKAKRRKKTPTPTSEAMLRKSTKVRPHFFAVKRRCFSEREKQKAV